MSRRVRKKSSSRYAHNARTFSWPHPCRGRRVNRGLSGSGRAAAPSFDELLSGGGTVGSVSVVNCPSKNCFSHSVALWVRIPILTSQVRIGMLTRSTKASITQPVVGQFGVFAQVNRAAVRRPPPRPLLAALARHPAEIHLP